jgi:NAD(P)-dependent dehydrogenase (short-subunit alcohol dehydrogenase family)
MLRRRPDILHNNIIKVLGLINDCKLPELQISSTVIDSHVNVAEEGISTIIIPDGFTPSEVDFPTLSLQPSGTYLVTDGYNGLALEIARWLAIHGAKHIALVSQQGRTRNFHRYAVQNLQRHGAAVYELQADLSQSGQFIKVLEQLKAKSAPVVRGIFHTPAAVLDTISPNGDTLSKFTARHAAAAHVLHQESRDQQLDFFVLLSTAAGLSKSPMLAEHAATAADYAALVVERRKSGQTALAIQMGLLQGVTCLQADPEAQQAMMRCGVGHLPIQSYLNAMEMLLQADGAPAVVLIINKVNHSII